VQEKVTTLLDALGLLLIAAGIGAYVYAAVDGGDRPARWLGVAVAGLVVIAGSALAAWQTHRAGKAAPS
jgi:ABC-type anion transport system duplicated permease subunit